MGGVKGKVTDVSGHSYDMASMRLTNGPKIKVICGGSRMNVPLKQLSTMKIDPMRISSLDGRPHYSVEIQMRDGTKIGSAEGGGGCVVCADNGLAGKSSKADYSAPFSKVSEVQVLGKEDKKQETKQGEGEEDGESEE